MVLCVCVGMGVGVGVGGGGGGMGGRLSINTSKQYSHIRRTHSISLTNDDCPSHVKIVINDAS